MIVFKGCKKCGGDQFQERDFEATSLKCLQCGRAVSVNGGSSAFGIFPAAMKTIPIKITAGKPR